MPQGKHRNWEEKEIIEIKSLHETMTIQQLATKYHTSHVVISGFVGGKKNNKFKQLPKEIISKKLPLYEYCECNCIPCIDNKICPLSEVKNIG